MKRSVRVLIEEAKDKMSGYVALFNFRLMNLCVKAEPAALLAVSVETDDGEKHLEEIADTYRPDDYHFAIVPKDPDDLKLIGKAIINVHPEFKQEIQDLEYDKGNDNEDNRYLRLTMPEVNEERHDFLTDGIDTLCKQCKIKLDETFDRYTSRMERELTDADDKKNEAKKLLKELYGKLGKAADDYRSKKREEIEEAYRAYLAGQSQKEAERHEKEKANARSAGLSMRILTDDDE